MVDIPEILFFVVFAGIVSFFVYRMFRFGGIKAAMFGARIEPLNQIEHLGQTGPALEHQ